MAAPAPSTTPPSDLVPPPASVIVSPPPATTVGAPPPATTISPPLPGTPPAPPPATTTSPPPPATPSPPPPTTIPDPQPPSTTPSPPPPTTIPASPPPPTTTPSPPPPSTTPSDSPPPPTTTSSPPPPGPTTSSPPSATPSPPPPPTPLPPTSTPGTSPPPPSSSSSSPPPPSGTHPSPPTSTHPPPSSGLSSSPPPPRGKSDSPPSSSNSPPPPHSSPPSGISTGVVVGVVAGGVVILAVLGLMFLLLARKKRRRNDHGTENFYSPPPSGPKDGVTQANQNYPPQHDQYIIPKPSNHLAGMTLSQRNPSSPNFMSSSGGSAYSGSDPPLPPPPGMVLGFSKNMFTYEELAMATDGFSDANLLGQGGFGYVHKGVLPTGKEVAVKSLKAGSGQGEREFQAEVEIISRVHHKHLVSLVGYCMTGSQRMLVYEFVPNDTLEFHLHGKDRPTLDWLMRLRIALGAAKGLAYLHEDCHPKIIHRDIKGSNILVDFKFESKVADFGLAKLCSDFDTHISTRVMGTFGYLAPEYASSGKLTEKSDVFSFGVVLLELISGRRPVSAIHSDDAEDSLVDWARPLLAKFLQDGNFEPLVDERLQQSYDHDEMARMVNCAGACVRHSARRRPRMSQIVRALEGDVSLSDLNEGTRHGQSSGYGSYGGSTDYDSGQYREDMKKIKKMAFRGASQEYGSSEYGGTTTSEYGINPSGTSSSEGQNTREMEMGRAQREKSQGFSGTSSSGERHKTSAEQKSQRSEQ